MDFLVFTAICFILAYYKISAFLILKFDFSLPIIALINEAVLLSDIYYIFLIYINKNLAFLSFLML